MKSHRSRGRHLQTLGLERGADSAEIRSAYRKLAKKYHPDCTLEGCESSEKFREIQEAYEELAGDVACEEEEMVQEPAREAAAGFEYDFLQDLFGEASSAFSSVFSRRQPDLEIILSSREAFEGVSLRLSLPVERPCHRCRRFGMYSFPSCPLCGGSGQLLYQQDFILNLPRDIADGSLLEIHLGELQRTLSALVKVR